MKRAAQLSVAVLAWISAGCDSASNEPVPSSQPPPARKAASRPPSSAPRKPVGPFLDQKKTVPPHLEWTREVSSKRGGLIAFRVESQGPFAITVVTDRAIKAMKSGSQTPIDRSEILLTADANGPSHDGKVTVPAGSSWFILENRADNPVEFRLQCSDGS